MNTSPLHAPACSCMLLHVCCLQHIHKWSAVGLQENPWSQAHRGQRSDGHIGVLNWLLSLSFLPLETKKDHMPEALSIVGFWNTQKDFTQVGPFVIKQNNFLQDSKALCFGCQQCLARPCMWSCLMSCPSRLLMSYVVP